MGLVGHPPAEDDILIQGMLPVPARQDKHLCDIERPASTSTRVPWTREAQVYAYDLYDHITPAG